MKKQDVGSYHCTAKNSLGEIDSSIRLYGECKNVILFEKINDNISIFKNYRFLHFLSSQIIEILCFLMKYITKHLFFIIKLVKQYDLCVHGTVFRIPFIFLPFRSFVCTELIEGCAFAVRHCVFFEKSCEQLTTGRRIVCQIKFTIYTNKPFLHIKVLYFLIISSRLVNILVLH